jgi:hypothetical protein
MEIFEEEERSKSITDKSRKWFRPRNSSAVKKNRWIPKERDQGVKERERKVRGFKV